MGTRLDRHLAAICLPREDLFDHLAANTAAALTSDYTEAGPRPGVAVPQDERSRLVPVVSGGQGQDLVLDVLAGGQPILASDGSACEVGYRFAGELDTQRRGWTAPTWLTGWQAIVYTDSVAYQQPQVVTVPTSQAVVAIYQVVGEVSCKRWDPTTWVLGAEVDIIDVGAATISAAVALPSDRILVLAGTYVYRSDDEGATWTIHARDVFGASDVSADTRAHASANADSQVLIVVDNGAGEDVKQFASDDLLASATKIGATNTNLGTSLQCVSLPTGGFLVAYIRSGDSIPCVRRISSAWEPIADALEIEVAAVGRPRIALVADPDGLVWAMLPSAVAAPQDVLAYCSTDGGLTWDLLTSGALRTATSSADYLTEWHATSAAGHLLLAHQWTASTGNEDTSVGMCIFGGWSTLTTGKADGSADGLVGRSGSGSGTSWLPVELPGDGLYTAAGAGVDALANGEMTVTTTADTRTWTIAYTTLMAHAAMWQCRVTVGGAVANPEVFVQLRIADGVADYDIRVHMATTGFRVRDLNAGTTLATVTISLTTDMQFAVKADGVGGAGVWYRRPGSTEWLEAWQGSLTNDGATPNANGLFFWGHSTASTSTSIWRFLAEGPGQHFGRGAGLTLTAGQPRELFATGRPFTGLPIPLGPDTGDSANMAWLSALGGTAALGEVYEIDVDHDYPLEHLFPILSPSPGEKWRSTDKSEQIIALDFARATSLGQSIVLAILAANFELAYLEWSTGGAWTTAAQWRSSYGFTTGPIDYALTGDTLVPGTTTVDPSGVRWLQENEAAGGYLIIETGGGASQIARRIAWHTAGAWTAAATGTVRPTFVLEDCDGTEDATGQATLVMPSGVLVHHPAPALIQRYWRVRIPASQITPDAYYEAGCICPMELCALGRAPDWGWSQEVEPNVDVTRSRRGTTRVRELGPVITTWTWAWTDGVELTSLRETIDQNYLGPSGGLALAAREDVPWKLRGLLDRARGGVVPVIALAECSETDITITDRTMWHYGRLVSSVRQENVYGREGTSETNRVPQISIEGIP